ncbi:methyl-accepting chemotaxis protein [Marinibaculum pumilum]|uniref:Methyl-accepting chemotaxis protein n=1 Tax=Marinibaculum pumilum TaxID=1766165 RepID=A0ABV7KX03_9PROT
MRLIDNMRVSGKVAFTTGIILGLMVISSVIAVIGLTSAQSGLSDYRTMSAQTAAASGVEKALLRARLGVADFLISGTQEAAEEVRANAAQAAEVTENSVPLFPDPEVQESVRKTVEVVRSYGTEFDEVARLQAAVSEHVEVMNFAGPQAEALIDAITVGERDKGNIEGLFAAGEAGKHFILAQLYANRFLIENTPALKQRVDAELADMAEHVANVQEMVFADEEKARLAELQNLASIYAKAFAGAVDEINGRNAVVAERLRPTGIGLSEQMATFQANNQAAQDELGNATTETTDIALITGIAAAVVALLLGILSAVLVGRGIARPIQSMTAAMKRLAEGDKAAEIPAQDRKDEVGEMAAAVQIFKDNMIRNDEMAAEQERERAAREARARKIEALTQDFDQAVAAVLAEVGAAAQEMQTTAASMSTTAEETNRQATAVAAASEQASTNVQTVASAAEELSSSIEEISRQVAQSATIAARASSDAERTNAQVDGLAQAAQKIGEVVSLIQDIAEQTNLLALNATIEAARAGEAGKGFAVVASEVKNLATQTAKATEQIGRQITGIQSETNEAVGAIQGIGKTIGEINEIATTIASAVEEQGAATQEISRNVQEAARGTQEVSSNIAGVTRAAADTGSAAEQVNSSAGNLAGQSDRLRGAVEAFLNGVRAA